MAAVLRKRHTLKGKSVVPLVKRLRHPDRVANLARLARDVPTEQMTRRDLVTAVTRVTGEEPIDLWEMAGHETEPTDEELRIVLHHSITIANELGQPLNREPQDPDQDGLGPDQPQPEQANIAQELAKVKQQSVMYALSHVKALAASSAPDQAVLVALDMLVDMAGDSLHPDLPLFQSLRAQASRMQDKLCIRGLCLEVLSAKENDKVATAVQKMLREEKAKKPEKSAKKEEAEEKQAPQAMAMQSVPAFQGFMPPFTAMQQPQSPFANTQYAGYSGYSGQQNFRERQRRGGYQRAKTTCHFCGMEGHLMRDCHALKKMREASQK